MANKLITKLHMNPIIGALHHVEKLDELLESDVEVVFILTCDIFELKDIVEKVKARGKDVYVHLDLIDGISHNVTGLRYINDVVKLDGIMTTKSNLIKEAKSMGIFTIQRLFLLDSLNLESGLQSVKKNDPDAIEVLPGVMPKIVNRIVEITRKPVITGGLVMDKEDVVNALGAGAMGVSTSKNDIWEM